MFVEDRVSIIVPAYNVEDYFERAVNSILSQTYKNIEIILVDDGSPDTSGLIGDGYAFHNENVLIIHKSNEGLSEARNDGVDISTGSNIAFVDSDDYILPEMYEKMVQCKKANISDIAVCQWQWQDKNGIWTVNHKELDKTINGEKSGLDFEKLTLRGGLL